METLESKDLRVNLFEDMLEIESSRFKNIGIEIKVVDPTEETSLPNAIYRIRVYNPKDDIKDHPSDSGGAYILRNGKIIKFGKDFLEYMRSFLCP